MKTQNSNVLPTPIHKLPVHNLQSAQPTNASEIAVAYEEFKVWRK